MPKEIKSFQTEIKQILDIMIHSLYSQREVFLRELISNSSDALERLRYEEITNPSWGTGEKTIRLEPNPEENTLSISDNGIGMTHDEVVQNIGTIAYSGTKNVLNHLAEIKEKPELIGQFGVGFYSAFMVADRVVVHTQKAGSQDGVWWESNGDGTYSIESVPRKSGAGTTVKLFLKKKPEDADESFQNFTDEWVLRSIVRKYSDFIEFPIRMKVKREEPQKEGSTETPQEREEDQTLNNQKALWLRPASDVKKEEYQEFYKHLTSDWAEPLDIVHYKAEGSQEFSTILYIPGAVPFDYYDRNLRYGLQLYVKRVFITESFEELLPSYLRFLKGVLDSQDLPLNVSREMIQKEKQIHLIRKALVSKVLRHLKGLMEKDRPLYEKVWEKFGSTLKEGVASDFDNKDSLTNLLLFHSSHGEQISSLKEYVDRMPASQKAIYFMTGQSQEQLASSPYLEKLRQKNYEVLYLTDPVDEWVVNSLANYAEKPLTSITQENLELDNDEEKKQNEESLKDQKQKLGSLTDMMKEALADWVKEVKFSDRLVESPVCLVSGAHDPSAHMEKLMGALGKAMPKSKRIMEINPSHPVFDRMLGLSQEKQKLWVEVLYNQALLNEGSPIKDPARFSKQISDLMLSN
ncbi:MAG: molecular chaperone HtpG [Oligoflexales bacterium]|nr:molecular chaperone HtpG [Oligoflexales bacterium]